jgi:hypothetical protein
LGSGAGPRGPESLYAATALPPSRAKWTFPHRPAASGPELGLCNLTQGVSPVKVNSWAFDSADSIPIGDCDLQILELQLQAGRNCTEGISALPRTGSLATGFLRLYGSPFHCGQRSGPDSFPAPVRSYSGAAGSLAFAGAFGFVPLNAALCVGSSAVRSY